MTDTEKAIRALTRGIDGGPGGSGYPICKGCGRWWPESVGAMTSAPVDGHGDGCPAAILDTERETIAALRRELAAERENSARQAQELRSCQEEKDEAERAHHRELAARTEDLEKARKALEPFAAIARVAKRYGDPAIGDDKYTRPMSPQRALCDVSHGPEHRAVATFADFQAALAALGAP